MGSKCKFYWKNKDTYFSVKEDCEMENRNMPQNKQALGTERKNWSSIGASLLFV